VSWDHGVHIQRPSDARDAGNPLDMNYQGMIVGRKVGDSPWRYTKLIGVEADTDIFAAASPNGDTEFSVQFAALPQQPAGTGICYDKPPITFPTELVNRTTMIDPGYTLANFTQLSPDPTTN
jgi:hypothetical protein